MGSIFSGIGDLLGVLFSPIHTVFVYVFLQPVFNVLMLIYNGVHSFGLSIIILTLLIRGALFPLTRKQLASSRKMQELSPKLKQIQAQYRGDNQGMVAAQQALYKEHGVSMYGGCLPLLIQMPFLYALYYSFYQVLDAKGNVLHAINGLIYPFLPHLSVVPNLTFLGFSLITPSVALALIAGVLTFFQMRMALPVRSPSAAAVKDTTTQTTQTMQYIMPVFTFFIGTRFPAGLALYWAFSTLFSAGQQYFISGWGSMWVGVPGMERYVPKPMDAPALNPPAITSRRPGAAAEPQQQPAGILDMLRDSFRQIREQASQQGANDRAAADSRRAGTDRVVEGTVVDEEQPASDALEARGGQSRQNRANAARDRRPRGGRSGAILVRQPSGETSQTPEARILDENTDTQPEPEEAPEKRIAREATLASSSRNRERVAGANASPRQGAKGGSGKSSGQNGQNGSRGAQSGSRNRSRGSR